MNVARNFLVMGSLYLVIGIAIGMYMGATGIHDLAIVHAHINLLGFTLMAVFGIAYKVFPAMAEGNLARYHFYLHAVGSLILLVLLFLLMSGMAGEAIMMPLAPISELLVFIGVLIFAYNAYSKAN